MNFFLQIFDFLFSYDILEFLQRKYGAPGKTDSEGFDPYSDTVGAGIYGGRVKRDEHGEVIIGRQYQVCYESLLYKTISLI